jgi:hypothetical protein
VLIDLKELSAQRRRLLLGCLILSIGCGTIGGSRTLVSVDSESRGQPVYSITGELIGKTPVFVELVPRPRLLLYTGQGINRTRHRIDCRFGWWQTPLENLPLVLVGTPFLLASTGFSAPVGLVAPVFLGSMVDTYNGAAFICPPHIVLPSKAVAAERPRHLQCGLDVPDDLDKASVRRLEATWRKKGRGAAACAKFVDRGALATQGRVTEMPEVLTGLSETERVKIYRFGYQTGMDQLVRFRISPDQPKTDSEPGDLEVVTYPAKSTATVVTQVGSSDGVPTLDENASINTSDTASHDLEDAKDSESVSNRQTVAARPGSASLQASVAKNSFDESGATQPKPVTTTGALPAVTDPSQNPASAQTEVSFNVEVFDLHRLELSESYQLQVMLPRSSNPTLNTAYARKYIHLIPDAFALATGTYQTSGPNESGASPTGSLVITQVSHPSGFRRWDYQLSIGSELVLDFLEHELHRSSSLEPSADGEPWIRYRRLGGGIGGNVDFHTPMGALRLGVALGGLIIDASQPSTTEVSGTIGLRIRHTVFLTEQVFAQFALDADGLSAKLDTVEINQIRSVKLQLGMHWPGIEGWMRSWL